MAKTHKAVDYSSFSAASRRLIEVSGTPDTAKYHAQINKRIEKLEQEVHRIHAEISALKTCRNAASKTTRLPIEILTRIFHFVSKFHTCTDILRVSHVCRHWRSIVLDHRQFFGDLQREIVTEEGLTRTMIWMSGDAPLTYSWTGSKAYYGQSLNVDALNEAVYDGVSRFKSFVCWRDQGDRFRITNPNDPWRDESEQNLAGPFIHWFTEGSYSDARLLEKLSIMNIVVDGYYEATKDLPDASDLKKGHIMQDEWSEYAGNRLLIGGAPVLRDLTLSYVGISWEILPLVPTLVHLRLLEDIRFEDKLRPTIPEFIASLKEMPLLETVELHNFLPLPDPDTPPVGEVFTFPSTLKTLKITDHSGYLSHFLQIAHVLDHVEIEVAFFQYYEINATKINKVIGDLKRAIGKNRANAGVTKLVDRSGLCFTLSYGEVDTPEEPGQGSKKEEDHFGLVKLQCGVGRRAVSVAPKDFHRILAKHFEFSCLQFLHIASADTKIYKDVWQLYNRLPKLDALVLEHTHFGSFLDRLEPEGPSSPSEEEPSGYQALCPFPALKEVTSIPPPKPKVVESQYSGWGARQTKAKPEPTTLQSPDGTDCASRFIEILNARKELGSPLGWVEFAEREVSKEVAEQLRESVPGLIVHRSVKDD